MGNNSSSRPTQCTQSDPRPASPVGVAQVTQSSTQQSVVRADTESKFQGQTFQVLLLGSHGSGKTGLMTRSQDGVFLESLSTAGQDFNFHLLKYNEQLVKLIIWHGIPPSSRFNNKAMVGSLYNNAKAVLFMYDPTCRENFDELCGPIWKDFETHHKTSVVKFVVATKSDLQEKRVVTNEEGAALAKRIGATFAEVSSRTGFANVTKLWRAVVQQLLPQMHSSEQELDFVTCFCGVSYSCTEEKVHVNTLEHLEWEQNAVTRVHNTRVANAQLVGDLFMKGLEDAQIQWMKELCLGRVKVLNERDEKAARKFDTESLTADVRIVVGGIMYMQTRVQASEGWKDAFKNKSTILNVRWMHEDRNQLAFRYDGLYAGSKFLAQGELRFDGAPMLPRIEYIEYSVISGFEHTQGIVGRGKISRHGANPVAETRNVQLVLRRIAVLNAGRRQDGVRLVDECYGPDFVVNVKGIWSKPTRDGLLKGWDDAVANKSTILEPLFLEKEVTEERVDYFYHGLWNGASFAGFCSTSFSLEGKFLSESWRVVQKK